MLNCILTLFSGTFDPDEALLNMENDLGALNVEGQRVLRVGLQYFCVQHLCAAFNGLNYVILIYLKNIYTMVQILSVY